MTSVRRKAPPIKNAFKQPRAGLTDRDRLVDSRDGQYEAPLLLEVRLVIRAVELVDLVVERLNDFREGQRTGHGELGEWDRSAKVRRVGLPGSRSTALRRDRPAATKEISRRRR